MHRQRDAVRLEIRLDLGSVELADVDVGNHEAPAPFLVAVGELRVGFGEDVVEELKVVVDHFDALHFEAVGSLGDGCGEVRHGEIMMGKVNKWTFEK